MSKTPRTDELEGSDFHKYDEDEVPITVYRRMTEHARELETELSAKESECERWKRQHEIVRDERASSFAMLDKAVGGTGLTEYQPEIDLCIAGAIEGIKSECETLREAAENLVRVKGRFHTQQAFEQLKAALAGRKEGA